jgi:glycosyltransferase involved in cell wall biosynthesis
MKILFITRGFPSDKNPMLGNYEAVQAKAIAAKGHEVTVLGVRWRSLLHILECGKLKYRKVGDIKVYECTRVYPFIPGVGLYSLERILRRKMFNNILRSYLKHEQLPDLVHAHILSYAAPAAILKEKYHLPLVITEHFSKANEGNITRRIRHSAFIYSLADRVISVSDALAESLKKNFGVDSVVVHNMVEDRFFNRHEVLEHKGFRFVSVGRLLPIKRFDLLIRAFAGLKHSNTTLDIIGGGALREKLQALINQLGLQERVRLTGVKKPEEVSQMLAESDCLVLSSKSETFGIVLIEAMAQGLPVVATRCGGPETVVNDANGLLVPVNDIAALTEAMDHMVDHASDYNKEEIRKQCLNDYSQDTIADRIIDVYKDALQVSKNK